ncbi:acetyltransferase [Acidovorax sp. Be4]|uniref:Acetyltransferase n=1 Tax=Acidovorax bellezanensis TaxID=2976702 RepID=A0ABT2PKM6_9BURK|nr:acetyltransferase [Acidovorax sp. Be4]MCT9809663.1 acetyltransferase [Acidovorax sp. Be4]
MTTLALFGAGGHGKVVADAALLAGWKSVIFFDDAWPHIQMNGHWPVAGNMTALLARLNEFDGVLVSIGHCAVRWQKQQALQTAGAKLATVVHPRACVSPYARLGAGTVVMAGAVVNVDTEIGAACIVNTGATVDHDCRLAHGVHICPGAHLSGNVIVGACSWVGVGAAVRQGIHIGIGVTVGAGAVAVKQIPDGLTVVGNPAAPLVKA